MKSAFRILSLIVCLVLTVASVQAQKVCHLILIGDTDDAKIGKSVEKDLTAMNLLFMTNVAERQLKIRRLSGDQVSEANIVGTIKSVLDQMSPEDTIFFYYSGHGAYTEGAGQYLQLPGGIPLYRSTLLNVLQERDVRLKVLMTDTCSVVVPTAATRQVYASIAPAQTTTAAFVSLCWNPKGLVDISASSKGEVAMGSNAVGGYFTHNFKKYLDEIPGEQVQWTPLISTVRERTADYFRQKHPDGIANPFSGRNQTTQTVEGRFQSIDSETVSPPQPNPDGPRFGVLAVAHPRGVVIKEVVGNSPATRVFFTAINQTVALETGDIITHINGNPVNGEAGYGGLIDASPRTMMLTVVNVRDGQSYEGRVVLAR